VEGNAVPPQGIAPERKECDSNYRGKLLRLSGWSLNWVAFLTVGAALLSAACEGFPETAALRRELVEEFRDPDLFIVSATDGTLTVTLRNPFPGIEEQVTCRRIAEFVRDHFAGYGKLNSVRVAFATPRSVVGISFPKTRIVCGFTRGDLAWKDCYRTYLPLPLRVPDLFTGDPRFDRLGAGSGGQLSEA
jgi:hypothetical protein